MNNLCGKSAILAETRSEKKKRKHFGQSACQTKYQTRLKRIEYIAENERNVKKKKNHWKIQLESIVCVSIL